VNSPPPATVSRASAARPKPDAASWQPDLDSIDVVINASGALQAGDHDDLGKVQRDAIRTLIVAC
jgi:hypothetical protein